MTDVKSLFDLSGKTALVTGGSRGLGAEIAEGLAEAGASLFLLARRDQWLSPTIEDFKKRGFPCEGSLCDVTDPEQVQRAVDKCIESFGVIDILVNNAGITWGARAEEMPLERWRSVVDVNLTGAWLFSQAAGRHMLSRESGNIVTIASIAGLQGGSIPEAGIVGYAASKAGVMGMTRELASQWGPHGIRVNAVRARILPVPNDRKTARPVSRTLRSQGSPAPHWAPRRTQRSRAVLGHARIRLHYRPGDCG